MPTPASFQGTPCLYCHDTTKTFVQGIKVCVSCGKTDNQAVEESSTAVRDSNGSLLCQTCKNPYPYAERDDDGKFHCYDCRLTQRIKQELNTPAPVTVKSPSIVIKINSTAVSATGLPLTYVRYVTT